jgi:hypothetical protein
MTAQPADAAWVEGAMVLGDVIAEGFYLRGKCRNPDCRHQSSLVVLELVERLGYDWPVADLRKRLDWSRCRRKRDY